MGKQALIICLALFITSCANSFYEAQTRKDAVEVSIEGRVIRVIDLGDKVEMIRKGYAQTGATVEHWEDFIKAGKKVTGCEITNIVPRPGVDNTLVWVQAIKACN